MTPQEFKKSIKKQMHDTSRFINKDAPVIAGKTAVDMFKENFQTESYFGKPWQEVQRRLNERNFKIIARGKNRGERRAKKASGRRKILTGPTGDLGRSIRYKTKGNGFVSIMSDPRSFDGNYYAVYHNDGTKTIPQRQFMGDNPKVTEEITKEIKRKLDEITGV